MKKLNKLFAILIAVLGVGSLSAQTDVTSTYLTNAGFETDGHQTGIKVPTGWTLGTTSGGYTSYRPISDTSTPNGSLPISNGVTAGASEGSCYLYMRTNWGASVCELTQTTQVLPAGKYKLMVDVALPQTQTSRLRTLTIKVTGSTSGTTNSVECCYNPSIWSTVCIPFEVSTEETVVISLYHNDTSGGCTDGVLTAVDNVRLLSYDYAALTSALTEAETLYDSSKEGATELNTAMNTAKSLTESSDKSNIASAAEALLNALDTYKQVQFVVPSSTDYTSWIANAQLETTTGGTVFSSKANMWNSNVPSNWYVTRAVNGNMNATTYGSGQSGKAFEIWATDANTVIGTFFQPISGLPAGKYTLKGYLQNSGKLFVTNGTENTEYSSSPSSTGSWQQFSVTFVKKSASDNLIIGAQTTAAQHFIVDGFSLECIGLDLLKLTSQRDGLVSDLEALQSTLPTTYYSNTVATAIETANAADTESTLTAAINNLSSILTTANSISDAYKQLKRLIDLCSEYTDPQHSNANSDEVLSTFNEAINTATTNGNAATTVDAINTVYSTLEGARQTYAKNAVPVYPYPFDMTFLLPNTTFDSNIDGWTKTGGANWMSAGKNVECYNTTFDFSMEYTGLNSGSWEIQVDAFYRYGGYNNAEAAHNGGTEQLHAILYANNNTVAVKSIMEGANKAGSVGAITTNGVRVPNGPADCDAYFATGYYANAIATVIADGKLKVGIKKETTQNSDWTIFDNFKLIYKGIDVTDLQNALSALITTAYAIKEEKMGTAESAALNTALDNADATVTNADRLSEMISNLQSAYDDAVASISTYAAVSAYIAKANSIHTSIAASYQAQYDNGTIESDAETVRQALNVATYEYVEEEFGNEIVLTDWGAASNAMWPESGEHWDGTTGEGCTSYYDANGTNTTHTLSKTVELTSGTYIFRGAGRSNTNTTLSLSIDIDGIEPVIFNSKGNTGRGIDKEGKATFADEAQYAKDGQGQGWEWEFIKFTLNETTIVTLTATCKTSGWGWASFANNGLWMDDATYVVANAGAITAPKAAALALVGTKPMGAAEDEALSAAIAQANETLDTPAKLDGAIAALETAVANAKAWVAAYNEAKAPLVAALERFEADFNDGANGALYPMSDEAWNTLLTAAGTAAEAKDVIDSYTNFATEAETFNNVMDAAESSIILYKKWAGLITSVQAYYDNIKQDAALNTAISTASAESSKATDASLTSATEALNAAYQEALDGDFDASIFLGDNLDFESGTGTALDKLVFEIPGWDIEYDGNVNENARIQPETYGESNAIRIRSNWEDAPTTMRVYKEVVLPSGSYNLSMTLLTSIAGSGVNLTYYELNGERTMLSSDTYKKVTAPSIELEEPTILLLSLGLTGTTGNNAQELYADSIALACNAKTLYQRTLEGIKALAEDGEPTLVITNVYNEYKDKEGSLTAEQKATAIAVMNNAISIDAADDMVTSLIKNADFTGGTNSYSVQGSGGQVQAPKEWTFGYTFEGWNDTKVTDGYFNLWAGVIKYGELSQVINNLPNGTYKLTADVVTSSTDGSSIVAIYGAPANGNIARSKNADNSDDYLNYEVYFKVVDNQATIGARTDNHYFKLKNIQLEYVEDDAVAVDNGILYQAAFINRGNTTWDITEITPNASEASIYMSSPNALIIANEGQVSNVNNVIVDGTAASLVLNDGGYAFNTTTDFTATALNYAREFTKDTWLTVCLPFAYPIPENVKVETLGAIDLDTKTFTFDEVTGTMEANTPYLIKNSTETAALFASLGDVKVEATPAAMNVPITADNSEHQGEFIGTYTTVKTDALMEDGTYDILFFGTDGQLYYLSQGVTTKNITIKPFRAYIRLPKDAINWSDGQQARVRHRNSAMTDIEGPELDAQGSMLIYDLMGRRVTAIEKGGIYIVNGKKVIVR